MNYIFSEGLLHLLLLLFVFLTLTEEVAGAKTEVEQGKPGSFTGGETPAILQLWRWQILFNNYSKEQSESNMQKLDFTSTHEAVACISGLRPLTKVSTKKSPYASCPGEVGWEGDKITLKKYFILIILSK